MLTRHVATDIWHDSFVSDEYNPIRGCLPKSRGCENCVVAKTTPEKPNPARDMPIIEYGKWTGEVAFSPAELMMPIKEKVPTRFGVCFQGDLFREEVPSIYIRRILSVMVMANHHIFMLLTKRPYRMAREVKEFRDFMGITAPLSNIWAGISVEDQKTFDERYQALVACQVDNRYVVAQPLLGPIKMFPKMGRCDWVMVGGEHSSNWSRPMHPEWVYDIQAACREAEVSFGFLGWGDWGPRTGDCPDDRGVRVKLNIHGVNTAGDEVVGGVPGGGMGDGLWMGYFGNGNWDGRWMLDGKPVFDLPRKARLDGPFS